MVRLNDLLDVLDPDPRIRGHQFELICKWYLQNEPQYRLQLKRIWLWKEWPGRWGGTEAGIDLVAESHDSKLWAIQAKAYNSHYSIKKSDVDTFLSESSRPEFSYRLLIATTNKIGVNAEKTLNGQEKGVGLILLSDLIKSGLSWPDTPSDLVGASPTPKEAFPYQRQAISAVVEHFKQHDRGQLLMACGTGKTLVSLWVAEELQSMRTLVLLPSLSLLAQTMREWSDNAQETFQFLPVCSDDTVRRSEDHFISRVRDLAVPATTDALEVAKFLAGKDKRVIFATYQSSPRLAEAMQVNHAPTFDLAIADEAHRCVGPATGPFATILDSEAIRANRRLFMTATPRYFTKQVLKDAGQNDFILASTDDQILFGPVFHRLKFSEAIRQDLLSDYCVLIVGVDDPTYRRYAEDGTFVTTDGKKITDARTLGSHIACIEAIRDFGLRRVISFHGRIKRAKEFSKDLPRVVEWIRSDLRPPGQLWSEHVHGMMPSGKRDALLDRFRNIEPGETGFLANARCLAEGVDLPTLDGVAFIDPKHSPIDIIQAVGRVIRKSPDKQIGTILIPVFADTNADAELALESSAFKPVWDVLKALRAHDDELAEWLDEMRRLLGRRRREKFDWTHKIILDLPEALGTSFAESFKIKIVEQSTASWEFWFGLLEDYVISNGHALVPATYKTEEDYKLGSWVNDQRTKRARGQLKPEYERRLELLEGWVWDVREYVWFECFTELAEFAKRHAYTQVREDYRTKSGFGLAVWQKNQRKLREILSPEKRLALERIPHFSWAPNEESWQEGLTQFLEFVKTHGHGLVPAKYKARGGFKLGTWVNAQRTLYSQGKLEPERVKTLEMTDGWAWNHSEAVWFECLMQLVEFSKLNGHTNVPAAYKTESGVNLQTWIGNQRSRRLTLTHEQVRALEAIPGWHWSSTEQKWEDGLAHLIEFMESHGHCMVPSTYKIPDGFNLAVWVNNRRSDYRKNALSTEQVKTLESMRGWHWNPREEDWDAGLQYALDYSNREGHCNVPKGYRTSDDFPLGSWVETQRQRFRKGILGPEKQAVLEFIDGWMWNVRKTKWEHTFSLLKRFVTREGHARVPQGHIEEGVRLGAVVNRLRQAKRRGELSEEPTKALESLTNWTWEPYEFDWLEGLPYLHRFLERENHLLVPHRHREGGFDLGQWVNRRRSEYKKGKLTEEQIKLLEDIDCWVWDVLDKAWKQNYELLRKFAEREGHALVTQTHVEDGSKLGHWVNRQRTLYKRLELESEKILALERVQGWSWNPKEDFWLKGLQYLRQFVEREGHARVSRKYVTDDGFKLGIWVGTQRDSRRALPEEKKKELEALPGWTWHTRKSSWEDGMRHLEQFVRLNGHARVPTDFVCEDGYLLGQWVLNPRRDNRVGTIKPERKNRLEKLAGWLW